MQQLEDDDTPALQEMVLVSNEFGHVLATYGDSFLPRPSKPEREKQRDEARIKFKRKILPSTPHVPPVPPPSQAGPSRPAQVTSLAGSEVDGDGSDEEPETRTTPSIPMHTVPRANALCGSPAVSPVPPPTDVPRSDPMHRVLMPASDRAVAGSGLASQPPVPEIPLGAPQAALASPRWPPLTGIRSASASTMRSLPGPSTVHSPRVASAPIHNSAPYFNPSILSNPALQSHPQSNSATQWGLPASQQQVPASGLADFGSIFGTMQSTNQQNTYNGIQPSDLGPLNLDDLDADVFNPQPFDFSC